MARLNRARSRLRCSSWSRTRIAHTSFGLRGRFWPMRRPLFHGVCAKRGCGWSPVSMIVSSETNPVLRSAGPRLTRDTIIYRRRLRLKKADLQVPLRCCSRCPTPAIRDTRRDRLNWVESAPKALALGRAGVRAIAVIRLRARPCHASRRPAPESRPLTPPASPPCAGRRTTVRSSRRSLDRRPVWGPGTSGAPSMPRSS